MSTILTAPFTVPEGRAVAVSMYAADGGTDEAVVMYSPEIAGNGVRGAPFSTFMADGAALTLTAANSPLVLAVPGQYRLQVTTEEGSGTAVHTSDPFPITLQRSV